MELSKVSFADVDRASQMGSIVREHARAMVRRIARRLLEDPSKQTPAGVLIAIGDLREAQALLEASMHLDGGE